MNNENFPRQLSEVKVTVNSNLNFIGLGEIFESTKFLFCPQYMLSSGLKNRGLAASS